MRAKIRRLPISGQALIFLARVFLGLVAVTNVTVAFYGLEGARHLRSLFLAPD